jgi:RimJ/RimL family protein N-acetyltransferase
MITGKRIRLRAIIKDDLPAFVDWLNDPEVNRHVAIYYPLSLDREEIWYADIMTHPVEEQPLAIEMRAGDSWKLIGDISFLNFLQHERCAEIGVFIGEKSAWSKGYGTEAMRLMVNYGFDNLNLNRIYLRVFETNPRAIRCYEKAGFRHEGRQRQAHFLDGKYIDVLMMSILKNEWNFNDMKEGKA